MQCLYFSVIERIINGKNYMNIKFVDLFLTIRNILRIIREGKGKVLAQVHLVGISKVAIIMEANQSLRPFASIMLLFILQIPLGRLLRIHRDLHLIQLAYSMFHSLFLSL